MIYIAPEVVSVAGNLSLWEFTEYASEALVFLGCVGEFIAEYTKWKTDAYRHTLGRRSLLFLILGIGGGLFSLIQTNALSGQVVGSLGTKAAEAFRTSTIALANANAAVDVAKNAVTISGTAKTKSDNATTVAGNAETLARDAGRDVRTVSKDLDSVNKQASSLSTQLTELSAKLTEANRKTDEEVQKRLKLEAQLINVEVCDAPRIIPSWYSSGTTGVDSLRPLANAVVFIEFEPDNEAQRAARNIAGALSEAKWDVRSFRPVNGIKDGVSIQPSQGLDKRTEANDIADALVDFLHSYNWQADIGWPLDATGKMIRDNSILPSGSVRVQVGLYPAVMYVPPPGAAVLSDALSKSRDNFEKARQESERRSQEQLRKMLDALPPGQQRTLAEQRAKEFDADRKKIMSRYASPCRSFPDWPR